MEKLRNIPDAWAFIMAGQLTRSYCNVISRSLPLGINLDYFDRGFAEARCLPGRCGELVETLSLAEIEERLLLHRECLENGYFYGQKFSIDRWEEQWYRLPARVFSEFTPEEIIRLQFNSIVQADIANALEHWPGYRILFKVRNSWWRWQMEYIPYNRMVSQYQGILRFDFGSPNSSTLLNYTTGCHAHGYAEFGRSKEKAFFLDGVFAYMVNVGNEHVLTIGFTPTSHGIMLGQVQLTKKRGNRWLYKLPKPLLEYVVDRMALAFEGESIWLANGQSYPGYLMNVYGENFAEAELDENGLARIARFYDQPLTGWTRGEEQFNHHGLIFSKLH